jgi:hypothetical protein
MCVAHKLDGILRAQDVGWIFMAKDEKGITMVNEKPQG